METPRAVEQQRHEISLMPTTALSQKNSTNSPIIFHFLSSDIYPPERPIAALPRCQTTKNGDEASH